jgi:hypothetical protein
LAEYNVYPLTATDRPVVTYTQKVEEGTPALVNGTWTQVWNVLDKTPEEVAEWVETHKREIGEQVQARLDAFARTREYDGILSLCTYASSAVSAYAVEGQYGVDARDATWTALYAILAEVETGARPMPLGYDEIAPELPVLAWPE